MRVAIPKERRADECRVAASPDAVRKLVGLGLDVIIETGAGSGARVPDAAFAEAGARIAPSEAAALDGADVVLKVQRPLPDEIGLIKPGAALICLMAPYDDPDTVEACAARGLFAFAMELLPRITRAQGMDVLSSQSNLAGYFAVIDAAYHYGRALPLMMTAAGTVAAARAFVLGAGVAGLQAIATARRLGALVSATDVRPAAKEQVESLGARFVTVEGAAAAEAETAGGYAREMGADFRARQAALIAETLAGQDIVITTALIPGRPAPCLIDADMVAGMRPGAVIVDLAAERGGNCALTRPGETVEVDGVTIIGRTDGASRLAGDASPLYARNLLTFLTPLIGGEDGGLKLDFGDEIIRGTLLTRECRIVHPAMLRREPATDEAGG